MIATPGGEGAQEEEEKEVKARDDLAEGQEQVLPDEALQTESAQSSRGQRTIGRKRETG